MLPVALLVLSTPPPPILFHNVAISADGKLALTGNGYDAARLIDLATGEVKQTFSVDGRPVAVALNGKFVLVATAAAPKQFEIATGDQLRTIAFPSPVMTCDWTLGGPVFGSTKGLFAYRDGKYAKLTSSPVLDLAVEPSGKFAMVITPTEFQRVDLATGKPVLRRKLGPAGRNVTVAPNGKFVVLSSETRLAQLFSTTAFAPLGAILQDAIPSSVAISPDSQRVVVGGGYVLQVAFPFTRKPGMRTKTAGLVNSVAFSPDGQRVIYDQWTAQGPNWEHQLAEWDLTTGKNRTINSDSE
jgi:WD40 repeat protein